MKPSIFQKWALLYVQWTGGSIFEKKIDSYDMRNFYEALHAWSSVYIQYPTTVHVWLAAL